MDKYIEENLEKSTDSENLAQELLELIQEREPNLYSSSVAIKAVKLLAFRFDLFRY